MEESPPRDSSPSSAMTESSRGTSRESSRGSLKDDAELKASTSRLSEALQGQGQLDPPAEVRATALVRPPRPSTPLPPARPRYTSSTGIIEFLSSTAPPPLFLPRPLTIIILEKFAHKAALARVGPDKNPQSSSTPLFPPLFNNRSLAQRPAR